jgi:predicted transcriptional regulator
MISFLKKEQQKPTELALAEASVKAMGIFTQPVNVLKEINVEVEIELAAREAIIEGIVQEQAVLNKTAADNNRVIDKITKFLNE